MKLFKRFFYIFGIVVLVVVLFYVYIAYKRYGLRKQLSYAKSCYERGDINNAIGILEEIYRKSPKSSEGKESASILGRCYISLGEWGKAEQYWNILFSLDKERYGAECLFNLSVIAKATSRMDDAIKGYEQLVRDYPSSELVDDALLGIATIQREKGNLLEAQKGLVSLIESYPYSSLISMAEKELGKVNIDLLFSPLITEGTTDYIVKEGDSLFTIAQNFGTTVDLIKRCNNLKSDFIKPGDKLKIITEKFSIVVDKSKNILTLKMGERMLKVYPVGTGVGGSTPTGTFVITNKLINPPWHKPGEGVIPYGDPRNVLGTRWMGFDKAGYGIHGTWEPESIGKQSSAGCIRLLNEDVEELFQIVPIGTEVTIVE